jgi:hypothetical protein
MEIRPRTRLLRHAGVLVALTALIAPASASAATATAAKKKRVKAPVVTRVSPLSLSVGETLTLRGKYFRPGRFKNTVVFKRDGGRSVFVKAQIGTKKLIKVKVPQVISTSLATRNGGPAPTRFRLRVLTTKLSKSYTSVRRSPVIGPEKPPVSAPTGGAPSGDCDGDGVINAVDTDDDNDLLPDATELRYKGMEPCNADSDGDGVPDGYEYRSALDLNDDEYQNPNHWVEYPGKVPYPNPLDATDANSDHDGDGLTLLEEYRLWHRYGNTSSLDGLLYSDGEKYSKVTRDGAGRRQYTLAAAGYDKQASFLAWAGAPQHDYLNLKLPGTGPTVHILDVDRSGGAPDPSELVYYDRPLTDGFLSDDERDEDGDGLTNYDEAHGRMVPGYWTSCYGEGQFQTKYAGTDLTNPDSDDDGILDGADDQDHDDVPNVMELSRIAAGGPDQRGLADCRKAFGITDASRVSLPWQARVDPFNPCVPLQTSRTCPVIAGGWAPFTDPEQYPNTFFGLN